jgi:hypothetical protein
MNAAPVTPGERVWLADGLASSPSDLQFLALGAPVQLFTLRAALRRQPAWTALGTAYSLATMLPFFRRVGRLYESGGRPDGADAPARYADNLRTCNQNSTTAP